MKNCFNIQIWFAFQAALMGEIPNAISISGSSLVMLSVVAFALEEVILGWIQKLKEYKQYCFDCLEKLLEEKIFMILINYLIYFIFNKCLLISTFFVQICKSIATPAKTHFDDFALVFKLNVQMYVGPIMKQISSSRKVK